MLHVWSTLSSKSEWTMVWYALYILHSRAQRIVEDCVYRLLFDLNSGFCFSIFSFCAIYIVSFSTIRWTFYLKERGIHLYAMLEKRSYKCWMQFHEMYASREKKMLYSLKMALLFLRKMLIFFFSFRLLTRKFCLLFMKFVIPLYESTYTKIKKVNRKLQKYTYLNKSQIIHCFGVESLNVYRNLDADKNTKLHFRWRADTHVHMTNINKCSVDYHIKRDEDFVAVFFVYWKGSSRDVDKNFSFL